MSRPPEKTQSQIDRYPARYRRRIERLITRSSKHADLLFSCPVAMFVLVTKRGSLAMRDKAIGLIENGAPLDIICGELEIPKWMRKLPPEAFTLQLPKKKLPGRRQHDPFNKQIVNFIPRDLRNTAPWLRAVLIAYTACDAEFALWIARNYNNARRRLSIGLIAALAAYAWYSKHPENMPAEFIARPWSPAMSITLASAYAYYWLMRVFLDIAISHESRNGIWAETRQIDNLTFIPLFTMSSLIAEANTMNNCLKQYFGHVLFGTCFLYSIRMDGIPIANMEIVHRPRSDPEWRISQLLGPDNNKIDLTTIIVASKWIRLQNEKAMKHYQYEPTLPLEMDYWELLWKPYWQAKEESGILTSIPSSTRIISVMRALQHHSRVEKYIR